MNVGSPEHGIHFLQPTGSGFDLFSVPDLLRVMLYKSNPPYGPQNVEGSFSGNPCADGDLVWLVQDQLLVNAQPTVATEPRDVSTVDGEQPTFHTADGLSFDTTGFPQLDVFNTPIQTGLTDVTVYAWGTYVVGSDWIALGNISGQAYLAISGNSVEFQDDTGAGAGTAPDVVGGKVLCIFYVDAAGHWELKATGSAGNHSNGIFSTFSWNMVGQATGASLNNSDDGNRHRGQIIIGRRVVPGSDEDTNIQGWITSPTGANDPGYSLIYTPPAIPPNPYTTNLQLQLLADTIFTDGVANGGQVATWRDTSGNGNDATQATGSKQPLLIWGALNGHCGVLSDGVDDQLSIADSVGIRPSSITILAVVNRTSTVQYNVILVKSTFDLWNDGYGLWIDSSNRVNFFVNDFSSGNILSSPMGAGAHVISCSFDGATLLVSVDGVVNTRSYSTPLNNALTQINIFNDPGGSPIAGTSHAILIYSEALSDPNRESVENWLGGIFGIPV